MDKLLAHEDVVKFADDNGGYDNIRKHIISVLKTFGLHRVPIYEWQMDMMILSYIKTEKELTK